MLITERYKYGRLFKEKQVYKEDEIINVKAVQKEEQKKMIVTISTGKTFDADSTSRINMVAGILASSFAGLTTTNWKLADNTIVEITLDELKEANLVALTTFGNIIGV
jgi:hypothetical protein